MAVKLYVSSLPYSVRDEALKDFFAPAGEVVSAQVVMERETNRSRGFGFVEMADEAQANKAIEMLDGKEMEGRAIHIAIARPKEEGAPRRSFGGGGAGGRDGGFRGGRGRE
ncbi:MAG: RNA recognition motif domain-containing protein [Minisyncoccia bacterium]